MPRHVWNAVRHLNAWIEPIIVGEWARLMQVYGERQGRTLSMDKLHGELAWLDPARDTTLARSIADDLMSSGKPVFCVWSGKRLDQRSLDIDHCPTEHYVNLPRDAEGIGEDTCPIADVCVVAAIGKDLAVLSSPTSDDQERLEALKYLGHWVGDVHQPMHVSFEDDRGGNHIRASGVCRGNLHAVWDRCIVEEGLGQDPRAAATELLANVTDEQRVAWRASSPLEWANESFAFTRSRELQYCVRTESGCWYEPDNEGLDDGEPERTVVIDRRYLESHTLTVKNRLVRAGVRLAGLLNKTLGR